MLALSFIACSTSPGPSHLTLQDASGHMRYMRLPLRADLLQATLSHIAFTKAANILNALIQQHKAMGEKLGMCVCMHICMSALLLINWCVNACVQRLSPRHSLAWSHRQA